MNRIPPLEDALDNGKLKLGKVFAASSFRENERGMVLVWATLVFLMAPFFRYFRQRTF